MPTSKIKLGEFMQDETGLLHGRISGLGLGSVNVISQDAVSLDGRPYLKFIADPLGVPYEVGAAFPKEKDGMSYYSVNLDSPLLPAPINAALFPDKSNTNTFNLVWNRPELPRYSVDAAVGTGQPQGRRYIGASAVP